MHSDDCTCGYCTRPITFWDVLPLALLTVALAFCLLGCGGGKGGLSAAAPPPVSQPATKNYGSTVYASAGTMISEPATSATITHNSDGSDTIAFHCATENQNVSFSANSGTVTIGPHSYDLTFDPNTNRLSMSRVGGAGYVQWTLTLLSSRG